MFDMERFGMPIMVEAHGARWIAVYRVSTNDTHHSYIAVPANEEGTATQTLPQPCSLILVPLSTRELESVWRRKEREAAEDAARKGNNP